MATLATQYVQIMPSTDGISGSIQSVLSGESVAAGKSAGGKISGAIKGAIGAAAIGTALKAALTEGAALEQSVGGIETLFKNSSDTVIANAKNAYKTAGVSANSYMEQVTSFSASLLQSLGGDTDKAATAADMAITDMADNANKMGTSMESIQYAYQGFAKQNYTMLDNLKLGYGGTKSEMERLLADASKISGQEYDMSNLNDVYSAIHVIQGELDITGTTSKEAASTLSGSFASMKSAATNVLGALVTGDGLSQAFSGLVDSFSTFFFGNLVPALQRMVGQLPNLIGQFVQEGLPNLLGKILELIPNLLGTISSVMTSLAENITNAVNNFAEGGKLSGGASKAVKSFAKGIIKSIPTVLQAVGKLVLAIVKAVLKLPSKLLSAGISAIKAFIQGIKAVKLPKMKITWTRESREESGKIINIPKPNISWYGKGGIFNNPSIIGVGERGSEAVVPLDKFWSKLDNLSGATINFNGNYSFRNRDDIEYFMKQSERLVNRKAVLGI